MLIDNKKSDLHIFGESAAIDNPVKAERIAPIHTFTHKHAYTMYTPFIPSSLCTYANRILCIALYMLTEYYVLPLFIHPRTRIHTRPDSTCHAPKRRQLAVTEPPCIHVPRGPCRQRPALNTHQHEKREVGPAVHYPLPAKIFACICTRENRWL